MSDVPNFLFWHFAKLELRAHFPYTILRPPFPFLAPPFQLAPGKWHMEQTGRHQLQSILLRVSAPSLEIDLDEV